MLTGAARRSVREPWELLQPFTVVLVIRTVYLTKLGIFVPPKAEPKEALTGAAVEQRFVFCSAVLLQA